MSGKNNRVRRRKQGAPMAATPRVLADLTGPVPDDQLDHVIATAMSIKREVVLREYGIVVVPVHEGALPPLVESAPEGSFVRVKAIRDVSDVPQGERTDIAVLRATSQQVLDEMRRQMATENAAHRALTERWAYIVTEDDGDDAMILIPNTLPNFAKTHGSTVEDGRRQIVNATPR